MKAKFFSRKIRPFIAFTVLFVFILIFYFCWKEKVDFSGLNQPFIQPAFQAQITKIEPLELNETKAAISILIRENRRGERVFFQKNINHKLPIASLTKLMTAYVTLRHYNLFDEIEISEQAILQSGNVGGLERGQKFLVRDLLYPLLIASCNDAAFALAEMIGEEKFVNLMNEEAERLGLKNSFFINSTGLDPVNFNQPTNYSTIEDLVQFTKHLLNFEQNDLLWDILSTREKDFYGKRLISTNQLLSKKGLEIKGGRTGWTPRASGSLILVLRDPRGYIINIVLGVSRPENRFKEMNKLINWIYEPIN